MSKKKKFKETKVGAFLTEKAPNIVSQVGEFLPDQGALGIVKNIITSDNGIEPKDKETALKLLDQEIQEMKDILARWDSDMKSDSWLSKNVRPLVLVWCICIFSLAGILDSIESVPFHINATWNDTFEKVMMAVVLAYFGGRTTEKATSLFKK